jgi:TrpR family trp operon transcriptional repressor
MNRYQKGLDGLLELFFLAKDKKMCLLLFDLFLTPEEILDLEKRFLIIKELLSNKKTQRQIAKSLNVSIAKITRGSNELKRIDPKLLLYLKDKLLE